MAKTIWYISKYVSPSRPDSTGAGGRGYLLMREFSDAGYECVIITSDSNPLANVPHASEKCEQEFIDGIQLYWVKTLKYVRAKSLRRILSWLDFEWRLWRMPKRRLPKPDAIIVSSLSLLTILNGVLLRRRFNCRLVFEVRDIWPLTLTEEGGFSRWNPLVLGLSLIEKFGYCYADAIVGTMPNLREHVENVTSCKTPVFCIPMGVNTAIQEEQKSIPTEYLNQYIPKGKFIVAHAGTIGATNALDTFFECARFFSEDPEVHFLIIGDGDLRKAYQTKYSYLDNLTFAPKVEKSMVQSVLSKCDLLYFSVHLSAVWNFGQSLNKVIDYMLSGKPVVASYNGFPSMINEAGSGTFVEAGDIDALKSEILRIKNLPSAERQKMGENGRRWILDNRNYQILAKQYLDILFPEH
ncbi:glycosyltransferase family 4 protein [Thalassospira sp. SN3W]|uniref:glycosyltransferase family 4 protein n=1 Tax=Thalassospira sp. SN3W TaxID=3035476 RepID=UPI00311ACBE8